MQMETEARAVEAFKKNPRVLRLQCSVQHYDWGDPHAIPAILGRPNPQKRPFAELWAGAHPDLPSQAIVDGVRVPLNQLMRSAAREILGPSVAARFQGELPFLLKIIAAAKPLSLQAHPNRAQALLGFQRENLDGLPLEAATRNYRDPHHKPELLVATSEFYALCGFRPVAEIEQTLASTPELAPLAGIQLADAAGLATLYENIMRLEQSGVSALLAPLVERLEWEDRQRAFSPLDHAYWILRANREFSTSGHFDRGLLSIFLLNLVRLRPGQAVFLPAGELHTYLQGVGVEVMANSNNVLRGGLTTKHVDLRELLHILSFREGPSDVLRPEIRGGAPRLERYRTPAEEFALCRLVLDVGQTQALPHGGMRLALVAEGRVDVVAEGQSGLRVPSGEAMLIPANVGCRISASTGAQLWLAKIPEAGIPSGG